MTADELSVLVEQLRARAGWQLDAQRDRPLSRPELQDIETRHQVTLPESFKEFLSTYGAGEFVFGLVYSPDPKSASSLWQEFQSMPHRRGEVIPFSDNGCGDYYCFPVVDGTCQDLVVWADHEEDYKITNSHYQDFRDFVARVCLGANQ